MQKNLVVLSGGGFKCAYQVGALKYLRDNNIKIDCIMGTSGGALNGLLVAQNKYAELDALWDNISKEGLDYLFESEYVDLKTLKIKWFKLIKKIVPLMPLFSKKQIERFSVIVQNNIANLNSLATSDKLIKILSDNTTKLYKEFYFNFTDLETNREVITSKENYTTKEEFVKGVAASASIPIFLNPIKVKTALEGVFNSCVDGGISSNVLVSNAVEYIKNKTDRKDWRIILIECNSKYKNNKFILKGLPSILSRIVLNVMLESISKKDIKTVEIVNKLFQEDKNYYKIPFFHIQPNLDELGGTLEINKYIHKFRINAGYLDTKQIFNN